MKIDRESAQNNDVAVLKACRAKCWIIQLGLSLEVVVNQFLEFDRAKKGKIVRLLGVVTMDHHSFSPRR